MSVMTFKVDIPKETIEQAIGEMVKGYCKEQARLAVETVLQSEIERVVAARVKEVSQTYSLMHSKLCSIIASRVEGELLYGEKSEEFKRKLDDAVDKRIDSPWIQAQVDKAATAKIKSLLGE